MVAQAADFNKSNYLTVPHNAAFNTMPLTISLWMKCYSDYYRFISTEANNDTNGWRLEVVENSLYLVAGPVYASIAPNFSNSWKFVVFTIGAGGAVNSYINAGSPSTSYGLTLNDVNHALEIGACTASGVAGVNYLGAMDEVILYNKELTPTEISALYNGGNGVFDPIATLHAIDNTITSANMLFGSHFDGSFVDYSPAAATITNNNTVGFVSSTVCLDSSGGLIISPFDNLINSKKIIRG